MRALLEVNALIALSDENPPFRSVMRGCRERHRSGWASRPTTQNGFARVVSQPSYAGSLTTAEALDVLDRATSQPSHEFWPDDLSLIDQTQVDRLYLVGPKQLTDIYLLALAVKHAGCLFTFDRSIPLLAAHGAEQHQLVIPR